MLLFRTAIVLFLFGLASQPGAAQDADGSLLAHAVAINQTAQFRWGNGIYVGGGFVLTASHVIGRSLLHSPNITIAGQELPARIVKQDAFERSDLALLAIDDQELPTTLRLHKILLCKVPPWPGEDVITVIPEEIVHSHILSPVWLPIDARHYNTVIGDVANTGNSGSGVFDAQKRCLLGIVSRKISESFASKNTGGKEVFDIAKYFVPASIIAEFLPRGVMEIEP
jgi:hypothetical protein